MDSSHFLPHKRTSEVQLKGCNYNEGRGEEAGEGEGREWQIEMANRKEIKEREEKRKSNQ